MVELRDKSTHNIDKINKTFEKYGWVIDGDYNGNTSPCSFKCIYCGLIRNVPQVRNITMHRCSCYSKPRIRYTFESFNEHIAQYHWKTDDDYINGNKPCHLICLKCGMKKYAKYAKYVDRLKCDCSKNRIYPNMGIEGFNEKLKPFGFTTEGDFITINHPVKIKCLNCGNILNLKRASNVNDGVKCRACTEYTCLMCQEKFTKKVKSKRQFCYNCSPDGSDRHVTWSKYRIKLVTDRYGSKCIRCGYDKTFAALDFHHRNGENSNEKKELFPCKLIYSKIDIENVYKELDKCDMLCANCHREVHEELNVKKRNKNN